MKTIFFFKNEKVDFYFKSAIIHRQRCNDKIVDLIILYKN